MERGKSKGESILDRRLRLERSLRRSLDALGEYEGDLYLLGGGDAT